MSTLYEIGQDMEALAALLEETGGDVSDEQAGAALDAFLAESADALAEKLDGYGAIIREFEARAAFRKAEAARLAALAATDEGNVKRMKERLRWFFEAHDIPKVETPRFKFSLATNGGARPVSLAVPPEALPETYRVERVTYSANTEAIRAALEAGEPLEFAVLGERGRHVRVR